MHDTHHIGSRRHAGRGHLKPLDGVRGLAILMVLCHHAFLSNFAAGGRLTEALGQLFFFGRFGVDLFFVLSGFLITGILLDTRTDPRFFRKFYGRRVLRIFPLYYGVLVLLFALSPLLHLHWQGMRLLFLFDLQNLRPTTINNFMLSPTLGLFHFWSLAVEEQFYLLWPAAVFFIRDRRTLLRVTLLLAAASLALRLGMIAAGASIPSIHVTTLCRADSLLLGGVIAMLYRTAHWPRVLRLAPLGVLTSFTLVAFSIALLGAGEDLFVSPLPVLFWLHGLRYTVLAIGFGSLLVCSLRPGSVVQAAFQHPLLRFFGKYSYGIYIFHVPFITLLLPPVRAFLRELTHSKGIAVFGSGMAALALSVAAAVLSFHLFEKPFLRLKRFFDYDPIQPPVPGRTANILVFPSSSDKMDGVVEAIPRHSISIR